MLDIFKNDAFGVVQLTDAINKIPFVPGRAGQVIDWEETGVNTTTVAIEERKGQLTLINPTPRGGPGVTLPKEKRTLRNLTIPHYQVDDAVYAEEIQNVRAFGTESQLEVLQAKVNQRLMDHVRHTLDPTLEYQRIGAIKGVILNQDGSTLYDLYTEFGVQKLTDVVFSMSRTNSTGVIRETCTQIVRKIAHQLGGLPFTTVIGFAGDSFWDNLIAAKETRETFLGQAEAAQLRGSSAFMQFNYGGILFENYRGGIGDPEADPDGEITSFVASDQCLFFPIGVPGLWRTVYAPADYNETVNTTGLPRYAKQYPMQNDKGIHLESQTNALSYCTRPRVLITGELAS